MRSLPNAAGRLGWRRLTVCVLTVLDAVASRALVVGLGLATAVGIATRHGAALTLVFAASVAVAVSVGHALDRQDVGASSASIWLPVGIAVIAGTTDLPPGAPPSELGVFGWGLLATVALIVLRAAVGRLRAVAAQAGDA